MKQFLPVKIEILYLTNEADVITTSGNTPTNDDEADVVQGWSQGWN